MHVPSSIFPYIKRVSLRCVQREKIIRIVEYFKGELHYQRKFIFILKMTVIQRKRDRFCVRIVLTKNRVTTDENKSPVENGTTRKFRENFTPASIENFPLIFNGAIKTVANEAIGHGRLVKIRNSVSTAPG